VKLNWRNKLKTAIVTCANIEMELRAWPPIINATGIKVR